MIETSLLTISSLPPSFAFSITFMANSEPIRPTDAPYLRWWWWVGRWRVGGGVGELLGRVGTSDEVVEG